MKKLVLAYSGGLDTSYCAKYLSKEKGFEVHAVSVNTGGFSDDEIATEPQLSDPVADPFAAGEVSPPHSIVVSGGQVIDGGVVFSTVIV